MLPSYIQRSDNTQLNVLQKHNVLQHCCKYVIFFIFPICFFEQSWIVGTYNNKIIYCGLSYSILNNEVIDYPTLCNLHNYGCDLQKIMFDTKICLIVYYVCFSVYTIIISLQIFKNIPELIISGVLNVYLYVILLYFANNIPHKFDNSLVSFDSSFGLSYICCNIHILDNIFCMFYTLYTHQEIKEKITNIYNSICSLNTIYQILIFSLLCEISLDLPLFTKPNNFDSQNIHPFIALFWIIYKHEPLYISFISLSIFTIFSETFTISMMKQAKYDTISELFVNIIFTIRFILHFISLFLIYLSKNSLPALPPTPPKQSEKKLKKHLHTIQAANRLAIDHKKNENIENIIETSTQKFTIS